MTFDTGWRLSKRASRAMVVAVPGATVRWTHRKIINTINSLNSGAAPSQSHPTCGHNCTAPAASHTCHATHVSRITFASASPLSAKLVILKVYLLSHVIIKISINKYLFTLLIQLTQLCWSFEDRNISMPLHLNIIRTFGSLSSNIFSGRILLSF